VEGEAKEGEYEAVLGGARRLTELLESLKRQREDLQNIITS